MRGVLLVLLRIVQLTRAFEQPARFGEVADELGGDAGDVVYGHQESGLTRLLRLPHERGGLLAHDRDVAANHVEERQVPEDWKELRWVAELLAQGARAGKRRLELRRGPALDRAQSQPADHLQTELELQPLGALRQAATAVDAALGERECFGEREQRHRALRGGEEVTARSARSRVPSRTARRGDRAIGAASLAVVRHERRRDRRAERDAARRLQRPVQRVLIQHVNEAIAGPSTCRRGTPAPRRGHEDVDALERHQSILDVGRVHSQRLGEDRRVELAALHARRHEQQTILLGRPGQSCVRSCRGPTAAGPPACPSHRTPPPTAPGPP